MKTFLILAMLACAGAFFGWPLWANVTLALLAALAGFFCLASGSMNLMLAISGNDEEEHLADEEIKNLLSAGAQTATMYAAGAVATVILVAIDGSTALLNKLATLLGRWHCNRCQNTLNRWATKLQDIGWED